MKKIVFVLAIALTFITCKEEKSFVTFSGKIINKSADKITITKDRKKIKSISVDENGIFSDTINNVEKGYYSFTDGKESSAIYLENGYDVNLILDTKQFDETIKYTGNGNEVNNYLAAKFLINEEISMKDLFALTEKEFIASIDTKYEKLSNTVTNLKNTDFVYLENKNLTYEKANQLNMYEGYHGFLVKDHTFKVSSTFPDALDGIAFDNDEDYKNVPAYQQIVIGNFYKTIQETSKKDSISFQKAGINFIKSAKGKNIKKGLLKIIANEVSARNEKAGELYKDIMAIATDDAFKKSLTKRFNNIKKTGKGMVSPKFVDYENYKGGTTSLDDLKGKFVYIDVWATWCGPCKAEIPFLQKVEKAYHGKNIHFVSLSIDKKKDHQAWLDMVKDKNLGGIQLFADDDWNSKFVTDYGIRGIPRFILVDPKGNIVSANAPRPSSPNLTKLFDENGI